MKVMNGLYFHDKPYAVDKLHDLSGRDLILSTDRMSTIK